QALNAPKPIRIAGNRLIYDAISRGIAWSMPALRNPHDEYEPFKDSFVVNSAYLNYGYVDAALIDDPLEIPALLEPSRTCIQLYHRVATQAELEGKNVLEVGCGRGGGSAWIAGLGPRQVVGVDLAPAAIDFCRRIHAAPNLSFRV